MDVSSKFLADRYGVSQRTIREWASKGLIVKTGKDSYELASADLHFINTLRNDLERSKNQIDPDNPQTRLLIAQCRKTEAEAGLKELELEQTRNGLISIKEVEETLAHVLTITKSRLNCLPSRVASELSGMTEPRKISAKLQAVIDEALNELSRGFSSETEGT
jgi:phage terminase Nu1 subunit (DNA packaging protein)